MRNGLVLAVISLLVVGLGVLGSAQPGSAAFHLMRVYGVMGGANGDPNIQYVELRLASPGQNFVAGQHLCFYNASGVPVARFTYASSAGGGADEASILVGTSEFDGAWAGTLGANFTFAGNTIALPSGAPINYPIPTVGKVSFGSEFGGTPATNCGGGFSVIDSVAYGGGGYTGGVDFGTANASTLPTAGTMALRLQGPICFPGASPACSPARNNSADYALTDVNTAGNFPRNNANESFPIGAPDADADGVPDATDLCPSTAPAAPVDANGCSQAQVDADGDGACDPGAVSGGPGPCTGTDNCPSWSNPAQGLPVWTVPANDPDCDGFTTAAETFVGSDPNGHCAATPGSNNEGPPDRWEADFDDNQLATTLDLVSYVTALNTSPPNPDYVLRADLNGNGNISTLDLVAYVEMLNKSCA